MVTNERFNYEVMSRLTSDTPDAQDALNMPYEIFLSIIEKINPKSVFFAMKEKEIIGITLLKPQREAMHTIFTGVSRDFRGKGIARALKLLSIRFSRDIGVLKLRTNNRSTNAPMLAINQALGYISEPGKWILEKKMINE
ncbi:GNAT family N-acetyltransferase [Paenibacillus oryzisoli]